VLSLNVVFEGVKAPKNGGGRRRSYHHGGGGGGICMVRWASSKQGDNNVRSEANQGAWL